MDAESVESILCPRCLASIPAAAQVCQTCGAVTSRDVTATWRDSPPSNLVTTKTRLQDRPWFVLFVVFSALFLAYPYLWTCPTFSRRAKVVLTVLVAIETPLVFGCSIS